MAPRRKKSSAPPRKPETAAELAQLIQSQAIKLLDKGDGAAANWLLIAEAALKIAFDALDQVPNHPRTMKLLRRVHSGAENRITQNPAYEREAFETDAQGPGWGSHEYGLSHSPGGPGRDLDR